MNKIVQYIILLTGCFSFSQTDSINTQNHKLKSEQLYLGQNTYAVYFQNESGTTKQNFEIWDRRIQQKPDGSYTLDWTRHSVKDVYKYSIHVDQNFKPITEEIIKTSFEKRQPEKTYYSFEQNSIHSYADTLKHNVEAFSMEGTGLAFNWELDLEILSMLPLKKQEKFVLNFYHPGSKTPPQYYVYEKVREEVLEFNAVKFNCWVLKIDHNEKQWSEFWIDKQTFKVLQMRDFFYGRFRYKKLVI
tara:strand:+ start:46 stop:780 length:735 start_codon:yes stop_codon:yes gene_type:complete